MKVLIRRVPDEYSTNLTPMQKIFIAATHRIADNPVVRRRMEKAQTHEFHKRMQMQDRIRTEILSRIAEALGSKPDSQFIINGEKPISAIICLPSKHYEHLDDVLKSKEFKRYNIDIVNTTGDTRYLFEQFPIFLRVSDKGGAVKSEK